MGLMHRDIALWISHRAEYIRCIPWSAHISGHSDPHTGTNGRDPNDYPFTGTDDSACLESDATHFHCGTIGSATAANGSHDHTGCII